MGQIIGEGILSGNSQSGRRDYLVDKKDQAEHSADECGNGYRYRT